MCVCICIIICICAYITHLFCLCMCMYVCVCVVSFLFCFPQKWPKIKSRLQVISSYKLWRGHLKEVEGHFGTAIVSYFVFLRWLFIMNLVIFALWFSIICIPQFINEARSSANKTSQLACLLPLEDFVDGVRCSGQATLVEKTYFLAHPDCSSDDGNVFVIQECAIDGNSTDAESSITLTASSSILGPGCSDNNSMVNNTIVYTVCVGVDPYLEWYEYFLDFFSGTGLFNETSLFQGVYPDVSTLNYNFPLAFLSLAGLVYLISVFLLIYKWSILQLMLWLSQHLLFFLTGWDTPTMRVTLSSIPSVGSTSATNCSQLGTSI